MIVLAATAVVFFGVVLPVLREIHRGAKSFDTNSAAEPVLTLGA